MLLNAKKLDNFCTLSYFVLILSIDRIYLKLDSVRDLSMLVKSRLVIECWDQSQRVCDRGWHGSMLSSVSYVLCTFNEF